MKKKKRENIEKATSLVALIFLFFSCFDNKSAGLCARRGVQDLEIERRTRSKNTRYNNVNVRVVDGRLLIH